MFYGWVMIEGVKVVNGWYVMLTSYTLVVLLIVTWVTNFLLIWIVVIYLIWLTERQTLQCHVSVFVTSYFHAAVQTLCGLPLGAGVFRPLPIMWLHLMIWKLDEVKKVYRCIVVHSRCGQICTVVIACFLLYIRLCVLAKGAYCGHFTMQPYVSQLLKGFLSAWKNLLILAK